MSNKFQINIPEPCHENWDKMNPVEQGRFCNSCQKAVVDFTGMSDTQLIAFFKKPTTGSVCGRFNNDQLNREFEISRKRIPWLKYIFQFTIPVFLTTLKAHSQGSPVLRARLTGDTTLTCSNTQVNVIAGGIGTLKKISGRVVDEKGNGIPYASINLKGKTEGTACDCTGFFTLNISPYQKAVELVASSIGYLSIDKEIKISKDDWIEIRMKSEPRLNGEVIVTSYTGTRKGMVMGTGTIVKRSYLQKVRDYFIKDSIRVYPNPAKSGSDLKIEIKNNVAGEVQIELFNMAGQLLTTSSLNNYEKNPILTYQLPNLIAGTYLLRITNKKSRNTQAEKIIIQ